MSNEEWTVGGEMETRCPIIPVHLLAAESWPSQEHRLDFSFEERERERKRESIVSSCGLSRVVVRVELGSCPVAGISRYLYINRKVILVCLTNNRD